MHATCSMYGRHQPGIARTGRRLMHVHASVCMGSAPPAWHGVHCIASIGAACPGPRAGGARTGVVCVHVLVLGPKVAPLEAVHRAQVPLIPGASEGTCMCGAHVAGKWHP